MAFWDKLNAVQNGTVWKEQVTQAGKTFLAVGGSQDTGHFIEVTAKYTSGGLDDDGSYILTEASQATGEGAVALVYWLPYKAASASAALRSSYEQVEKCNYFMTTAFTGCRFTLTPTHVLHVAADAGPVEGNFTKSQRRTAAEDEVLHNAGGERRRLSVSMGKQGLYYKDQSRVLVFGVRTAPDRDDWTYKVCYPKSGDSVWKLL